MSSLALYLCRHGDTEWSPTRRLAGDSDIPLTTTGEDNARQLGARLRDVAFDRVLVSPRVRAQRTASLAGFGDRAETDARLAEMSFGRYEGRTVAEIREQRPGWSYWQEGASDGEGPADVGRRVDALLGELDASGGTVCLFAHSVVLRVLAARFLGLAAHDGRLFMMSPGALGILRYDPIDASRAIAAWNERAHLPESSALA